MVKRAGRTSGWTDQWRYNRAMKANSGEPGLQDSLPLWLICFSGSERGSCLRFGEFSYIYSRFGKQLSITTFPGTWFLLFKNKHSHTRLEAAPSQRGCDQIVWFPSQTANQIFAPCHFLTASWQIT